MNGWFPDPSGRFGRRWYDGFRWTDSVVAADGRAISDPLPEDAPPYPPPPDRPPAPAPGPPPAPGPAPTAPGFYDAPRPTPPPGVGRPHPDVRFAPGAALVVGLVGLVLVALSLLGLSWADHVSFLDIGRQARKASLSDATTDSWLDGVPWLYVTSVGFVLLALAALWVVLAGIPAPNSYRGDLTQRTVATCICAVGAVLHTVTVVRMFRGPASPDVGAWLGVVGYFVAIIGLIVGNRARRPAGRAMPR